MYVIPFHQFNTHCLMDITPDLPFLNIHNLFTNERISVYLNKHSRMPFGTNDYCVKHIIHLSKDVVIGTLV